MKRVPISSKYTIVGKTASSILKKARTRYSDPEDKEYRAMKRLQEFAQIEPPRKGVFATLSVEDCAKYAGTWKELVIDQLNLKLSKDTINHKSWRLIIEWEKFQLNSKGPVVVNFNDLKDALNKIEIRSKNKLFSDEIRSKYINPYIKDVMNELEGCSIRGKGMKKFDFQAAWSEMDGQTLRGLPFDLKGADVIGQNSKGKDVTVDDLIKSELGNDMSNIITTIRKYWSKLDRKFISVTRNRLQSPNKYRFINVVFSLYQYLLKPIADDLTEILKQNVPWAAAWNEPLAKEEKLWEILDCEPDEFNFPKDYSGFDQLVDVQARMDLREGLLRIVYNGADWITEFMELCRDLEYSLMILVPTDSPVSPMKLIGAMNLLPSGIVLTSIDGSMYSAMLSRNDSMIFKTRPVWYKSLFLSDDTVEKVKKVSYQNAGSYTRFLEMIEEGSRLTGAVVNMKKQIPESMIGAAIYLQRLYYKELNIFGLYSLTRSIDSLIYAERFQSQVVGIRNIPALQQVGQMSVLNNNLFHPLTKIHYDDICLLLISRWLQVDTKLYSVFKEATKEYKDDKKAGLLAFNYICYSAGGIQSVLRSESFGEWSQLNISYIDRNKVESVTEHLPILEAISKVVRQSKQGLESDYHQFYKIETRISKKFIEWNDVIWSGGR